MRYLGMFPSEAQVNLDLSNNVHLTKDDPDSATLKYENVEGYLLDLIQNKEYRPSSYERMMEAFRTLDTNNTGMIRISLFKILVQKNDLMYTDRELEEFIAHLPKDPS